jgi:hypothetical protein
MKNENWWLVDKYFIDNTSFNDKMYFYELGSDIKEYTHKAPIPIVTKWLDDKHSILVKIGKENSKVFKCSSDISTKDFVTLIENWSQQFYPSYEITEVKKIPLSSQEKADGIKEGRFSLDESFNQYQEKAVIEKGIITRVFFLEDKFTISINGKKEVRMTGNFSTALPISQFLKSVRKIKDPEQLKAYIFSYSTKQNSNVREKEISINYTGKKLINFFKINKDYLLESNIIDMGNGFLKSGKFIINTQKSESIVETMKEIVYN